MFIRNSKSNVIVKNRCGKIRVARQRDNYRQRRYQLLLAIFSIVILFIKIYFLVDKIISFGGCNFETIIEIVIICQKVIIKINSVRFIFRSFHSRKTGDSPSGNS